MMEKLPQIAEALLAGKVVLLPTDTVYGLSCLMNSQAAIERIYQIKGRDNSKAFIYLVNSWEMAEKYAILDSETRQQAAKYWPGANTLILNSCLVDQKINNGLKTIALRWPKLGWLESLIGLVGQPLASTSANLSGQTVITSYSEAFKHWGDIGPDLIVDGGEMVGQPSKIFDLTNPLDIKRIR